MQLQPLPVDKAPGPTQSNDPEDTTTSKVSQGPSGPEGKIPKDPYVPSKVRRPSQAEQVPGHHNRSSPSLRISSAPGPTQGNDPKDTATSKVSQRPSGPEGKTPKDPNVPSKVRAWGPATSRHPEGPSESSYTYRPPTSSHASPSAPVLSNS